MKTRMRAIDFFCGAGGLSRGLLDAGIQVIAGFDSDGRCRETYERNNRGSRFYEQDVSKLDPLTLWKVLGARRTSDVLFAGCAPCQPFSKHRRSICQEDDRRLEYERQAKLLGAFARLVSEIRPGQVLIENVPGLTRVPGFSTYRRFVRTLRSLGYQIAEAILDAKDFGVPQTRRRFVLLAMQKGRPTLPTPQFGRAANNYTTVGEAIAHYPPIRSGERHLLVPNHEAAAISQLNLKRLQCTPHNGGDRRAWARELVLACHKGSHSGHTDVYGRMAWNKPAPTLTGRCNSISNGRYGHPCQDRALSLREAASLQTFADDYVFYGAHQHIARQIGNAVPVKFGEWLGRHILSLRNNDQKPI
jgi:DNA (cytosine-5)-methyltransferase 1